MKLKDLVKVTDPAIDIIVDVIDENGNLIAYFDIYRNRYTKQYGECEVVYLGSSRVFNNFVVTVLNK